MREVKSIKVKEIAHHRNGVSGNGFHIVLFKHGKRNMMAVAFDDQPGSIAILDTDLLAEGNIKFGENSWRHETYAPAIEKALKEAA
jgi:hypothetical protein